MENTFTCLLIDPGKLIIREVKVIDSMRVYKKYLGHEDIGFKELNGDFDVLYNGDTIYVGPEAMWKFRGGNEYYRGKSLLLSKPAKKTKYGLPYIDNKLSVEEAMKVMLLYKKKSHLYRYLCYKP